MSYRLFSTSKQVITSWFHQESLRNPVTIGRIHALNQWIALGKSFPYHHHFIPNIASFAREKFTLWEHETHTKPASIEKFVERAVFFIEKKKLPGSVIEVGAGYSGLTPILLSLNRKVTLVDPCQSSLDLVVQNARDQRLNLDHLTTVTGKIEHYTFPKETSLIVMQDVLPYCDPLEISRLFQDIHASLREGGILTGSFFYYDTERNDEDHLARELYCRFTLGATFVTDEVARALFQEVGFQILEYGIDGHKILFTLRK